MLEPHKVKNTFQYLFQVVLNGCNYVIVFYAGNQQMLSILHDFLVWNFHIFLM
jgi:hypothetical protein